jgi:hypothetical protein
LLSEAIEAARTIEDALIKSWELGDIACQYAGVGDFIQALGIARTIEDAESKSWALEDIAGRIAQLSEKNQTVLLGITHDIRPLGQFFKKPSDTIR